MSTAESALHLPESPPSPERWRDALGFLARRGWRAPDAGSDEQLRGELAVARARLVLTGSWCALHAAAALLGARDPAVLWGLAVAVLGLAVASAIHEAARREWWPTALPFVSPIVDGACVTGYIATMLLLQTPLSNFYALAIFPGYVMVIVGTILRMDARVSLVAGLATVVQYEFLALWLKYHLVPNAPAFTALWPTPFDLALELVPPFLLLTATAIVAMTILRTQHLRLLSTRDVLTGLPNRAFLGDELIRETQRASRIEAHYTVVMLDIDHFKRFNDCYGHAAGDAALRTVASVLKSAFRATDVVARYGGEEFVALMLYTDSERVLERLERVRRTIAGTPIHLAGSAAEACSAQPLTLSAGVASYPVDGRTPDHLLETADRRLYRAKARGRNQIIASDG